MVNLPTWTPLSFIYFGAAGIAAYFAVDLEPLRWLAYAAAMMFFVRGPSLYVRDVVARHPGERSRDVNDVRAAIELLTFIVEWLGYVLVGYWLLKFAVAI